VQGQRRKSCFSHSTSESWKSEAKEVIRGKSRRGKGVGRIEVPEQSGVEITVKERRREEGFV